MKKILGMLTGKNQKQGEEILGKEKYSKSTTIKNVLQNGNTLTDTYYNKNHDDEWFCYSKETKENNEFVGGFWSANIDDEIIIE